MPLLEWALTVNFHPPLHTTSLFITMLCSFWKKFHLVLYPGHSSLTSFSWHPNFHEIMKHVSFSVLGGSGSDPIL